MIIAYIDGANLYKGVEALGWHMSYTRFRVYLMDKLIEKAPATTSVARVLLMVMAEV